MNFPVDSIPRMKPHALVRKLSTPRSRRFFRLRLLGIEKQRIRNVKLKSGSIGAARMEESLRHCSENCDDRGSLGRSVAVHKRITATERRRTLNGS